MPDEKLSALQDSTAIADTDLLAMVKDMGTVPLTVAHTFGAVKAAVGGLAPGSTAYFTNAPDGTMLNGKIVPSVASNNLTLALKTVAGNNPSASEPVWIKIAGTWRTVTAALSVTKNAGTNWFNAGSAELATNEIDYFAYIGYNATDGVVIGFSRIPYANLYSDFSATSTNEKYAAISTITNAAAGDNYVNIGRFAATLSAGAGYTWTVPTFTSANLIQKPIHYTRWLTWVPTSSCSGSLTYSSVTYPQAIYCITERGTLKYKVTSSGTLGGSASNTIYLTTPFKAAVNGLMVGAFMVNDAAGITFGGAYTTAGTPDKLSIQKYLSTVNYSTSGTGVLTGEGFYEV